MRYAAGESITDAQKRATTGTRAGWRTKRQCLGTLMYFSQEAEDLDMGLKKGENILPCLPLVSSSSAVGKSPGSEFVPGPSCSAENMK